MKIVINKCYGGFGLSPEATLKLYKLGAIKGNPVDEYWGTKKERDERDKKYPSLSYTNALNKWREYLKKKPKEHSIFLAVFSPDEKFVLNARDIARDNPHLVSVVEKMKSKANGSCAKLAVVEIPDGTDYEIGEYDGMEHIAEKHRTWG